jgi:cellulose biosynthesis protein BcsQ
MTTTGQIITFYSYKGGVGRSMAVANIATLLAQQGKRVLAVDFDLDAPGLHRYLLSRRTSFGARRHEPLSDQAGVIELFGELQARLEDAFPGTGDFRPEEEAAREKCKDIAAAVVNSTAYSYRVALGRPDLKPVEVSLSFLSAGRFDETYPERVRTFDWQIFYEEFAEIFLALRDAWKERYDYVLIDSRTGLTDIGSICTVVLPDKLVVAFSPNDQSLHGVLEIARQAVTMHAEASDGGILPVFPLLSRVDPGEEELRVEWIRQAADGFSQLFADLYEWKDCDLERYFNLVHIPHSSYYSYGEKITVEERPAKGFGSLAEGYARFLECLQRSSVGEWLARSGDAGRASAGDRALVVGFDGRFEPPHRQVFERIIAIPEALPEGPSTRLL